MEKKCTKSIEISWKLFHVPGGTSFDFDFFKKKKKKKKERKGGAGITYAFRARAKVFPQVNL